MGLVSWTSHQRLLLDIGTNQVVQIHSHLRPRVGLPPAELACRPWEAALATAGHLEVLVSAAVLLVTTGRC